MGRRWAELTRHRRRAFYTTLCAACAVLLAVACTPPEQDDKKPPVEERVELMTGMVEPNKTQGAPYPPAEPSDYIPNLDEEEWPKVPDGPTVGDMQPANPQVEVKKVVIE